MKLITKQLEKRFEQIGSQDGKGYDAIVIAKFFDPTGSWSWFATEYDLEARIFFGYVIGFEQEWGNFSLDELESVRCGLNLGIERDLHCGEKPLWEHFGVDVTVYDD